MLDLSARVFYKAHFNIEATNEKTNIFEVVISELKKWMKWKFSSKITSLDWKQFRRSCDFHSSDGVIAIRSTSVPKPANGLKKWACKIEEYQPSVLNEEDESVIKTAPRTWTTEVGFQQLSSQSATVSYVLYYEDKAGFVGAIGDEPTPTTPSFIMNMLRNKWICCKIGIDPLSWQPIFLQVGEGKGFIEKLQNPNREISYIFVSPDLDKDGQTTFPVDVNQLTKNVQGNALVYTASSMETMDEIAYFMDHELLPRRGQIKIYYPPLGNGNVRYHFISAMQINSIGKERTIAILRRVFSTDIRYYDAREMFRMGKFDALFAQKKNADLQEQIRLITEREKTTEAGNIALEEQVKYHKELWELVENDNESLRQQLNETKAENYNLNSQVRALRAGHEKARGLEASLDGLRNIQELPQTPYDIGVFFRKVFQDKLDFTERGLRSLKDCPTHPATLWKCLYDMAVHLTDMHRNHVPDIEDAFKRETGWEEKRGEGMMTRKDKRLMSKRLDEYNGKTINIERHVSNGSNPSNSDFIRIYYYFDPETSKIIIGHAGKHLENYSTRKL